jgi:hypothetical protein
MRDFIEERDAVLLSLDVKRMVRFYKKYNGKEAVFSNEETALAAMHKARTAAKTLPLPERQKSKAWLTERGLTSMDDGDL